MPASSIAASISDAALLPFWAKMNVYWASKLTHIRLAPSSASSQVANAMTRLPGTPSGAELERFFFLDDKARALADKRRGDHNRLGFVILRPQASVHDVHDLG
jgi:hypothetical protein